MMKTQHPFFALRQCWEEEKRKYSSNDLDSSLKKPKFISEEELQTILFGDYKNFCIPCHIIVGSIFQGTKFNISSHHRCKIFGLH